MNDVTWRAVMWRHITWSDITSFTLTSCDVIYDLSARQVTSFITRYPWTHCRHPWMKWRHDATASWQNGHSSCHPGETSIYCFLLKRSRFTDGSYVCSFTVIVMVSRNIRYCRSCYVTSCCWVRRKWSVSDVILGSMTSWIPGHGLPKTILKFSQEAWGWRSHESPLCKEGKGTKEHIFNRNEGQVLLQIDRMYQRLVSWLFCLVRGLEMSPVLQELGFTEYQS
jgi:hypothetical protein